MVARDATSRVMGCGQGADKLVPGYLAASRCPFGADPCCPESSPALITPD